MTSARVASTRSDGEDRPRSIWPQSINQCGRQPSRATWRGFAANRGSVVPRFSFRLNAHLSLSQVRTCWVEQGMSRSKVALAKSRFPGRRLKCRDKYLKYHDYRFSVAPMMDRTDRAGKAKCRQHLRRTR